MSNNSTIDLLGYQVYTGNRTSKVYDFEGVVNTINPHSYCIARKDSSFRKALQSSETILPDGIGVVFAARILTGKQIPKIAGSDLHKAVLKMLNEKNGSCFYLGSSEETLHIILEKLSIEYPNIKVGSYSPPYKTIFSENDNRSMVEAVNAFKPDVLFVGMTAPKQEKWVYEHKGQIKASMVCSIGAVFDFFAGTVKRPGSFWISIGLEWLPRLLREPRRLWRRTVISTPLFVWYVMLAKLRLIK